MAARQDRVASLRAKFAATHGADRVRRAEAVALLDLSVVVWELASQRRQHRERVFAAARSEAEEMPPGWKEKAWPGTPGYRSETPTRPWPARWPAYVWRALEEVAEAAAVETEWAELVVELSSRVGRLAYERRPRRVVMHGWTETPIVMWEVEAFDCSRDEEA